MRRLIGVVLVLGLGLAWSDITMRRVQLWGDPLALWLDAVEQAPAKPRPRINLGNQYGRLGRPVAAAQSYRHALTLAAAPARTRDELVYGTAIAEASLALRRAERGDVTDALRHFVNVLHRFGLKDIDGVRAWLERRSVTD